MKEKKLEFFGLNYDKNEKKVVSYNIFRNVNVKKAREEEVKNYLNQKDDIGYFCDDLSGFDALVEKIDNIIKWQEAHRREYEISVGDAFTEDCSKLEKWDCYSQATPNKILIAKLCLDYFGSDV